MTNIELLKQAVKWARYEHDTGGTGWDQEQWFLAGPDRKKIEDVDFYGEAFVTVEPSCGTAYCVAGWVVQDAGLPIVMREGSTGGSHCLMDGKITPIAEAAMKLLDINYGQSNSLFSENNSIERIEQFAEAIIREASC